MTQVSETEETMRLVAPTVPTWAVRQAAREMKGTGIPVRQSSLVLFAIGRLIGIPDDKLPEFVILRSGRKSSSMEQILDSLEEETAET